MTIKEIINERDVSRATQEYEIVGLRSRAKMIEFMMRDGSRHAANYSFLHGVHSFPAGLRLDFVRFSVEVKGRNLKNIHHALADHRVNFLRESKCDTLNPAGAVYIERITVQFSSGSRGAKGPSGNRLASDFPPGLVPNDFRPWKSLTLTAETVCSVPVP